MKSRDNFDLQWGESMKKILMIGITNSVGGIETYILNLLRCLNKEKYKLFFPYIKNMAYYDEIIALGGEILSELPRSRRNPAKYYYAWKQIIIKEKFDVIYYNDCDIVNLSVLRIAKRVGIPIRIFHAHNSSSTKKRNIVHRLSQACNRFQVRGVATDLLACSKNAGDFMFGKHPYCEIKNGISLKKYKYDACVRENRRKQFEVQDARVYLFVGRLTEVKNPLFALDVFNEIYKKDTTSKMFFCGNGPLMQQLQQRINEYGLRSCVFLLGNCADVNELYSLADYLIMPSLFEGFPFVLVEAQCGGLKCICSDTIEKNTNISNSITYIDLEIGAQKWAEKILKLPTNVHRESFDQVIRDAGFDIEYTVNIIEKLLEGE